MMSDGGSEEERLLDPPDDRANPERLLLDQVIEERLQEALNALPDTYHTAILLCDVEERTYEEVARIMRCSVGTVRSRIHRGRVRLRTKLAPQPLAEEAPRRQC
jgi:RNA polymerase sigma-70 factor (ECF subfamily)